MDNFLKQPDLVINPAVVAGAHKTSPLCSAADFSYLVVEVMAAITLRPGPYIQETTPKPTARTPSLRKGHLAYAQDGQTQFKKTPGG